MIHFTVYFFPPFSRPSLKLKQKSGNDASVNENEMSCRFLSHLKIFSMPDTVALYQKTYYFNAYSSHAFPNDCLIREEYEIHGIRILGCLIGNSLQLMQWMPPSSSPDLHKHTT